MANRSALSYIINEEQDGFVAVDFDFINGHDEVEANHHDLTAWEFVDEDDADVDDCSSIGDKSDDVSDSDGFTGSLASDVSTVYFAETIAGDLDDRSSIGGGSDDGSENFDFSGSVPSDVSSECLDERIAGGDAKSVPESVMSPEYSHGTNAGEHAKSVTESIISPGSINEGIDGEDAKSESIMTPVYSDESIGGEDAKSVPESKMTPEYTIKTTASHYQFNAVHHGSITAAYRSGGEKYCYEEEEDEEEDDYDLDDELVPYCVNGKLGRERMRKLGKRSCAKSVKSKRLTYNYNKAGCFRGKHGLGLKHSLI